MRKKITILKDSFFPLYSHQIDHYATRWSHMGYYVSYSYDGNNLDDADMVILCIDKSRVPKFWIMKISCIKAKILNFSILDTSKRRFSKLILGMLSNYAGEVIVKTNRNAHGGPEMVRDVMQQKAKLFNLNDITQQELKAAKGRLMIKKYQTYASAKDVPCFFWDCEDLVVERYVAKLADHEYYRVYFYSFFGDRGICGYIDSSEKIVRWENSANVEYIAPIPIVYYWKNKYRIDFGRFDFLFDKGEWLLIDINKTEGSSRGYLDIGTYEKEFSYLAEGIKEFI